MCGRYQSYLPAEVVACLFDARVTAELPTHYNAAPTQSLPALRTNPATGERQVDLLRWGLIPLSAATPSIGARHINARAESAHNTPVFREAFARRRCLVPASGFYEWQKSPTGKQPYAIMPTDGPLFAFAGLWDRWRSSTTGDIIRSFAILTTRPNALMAPIHDRMPVILPPEDWARWLGEAPTTPAELAAMIREPYPSQLMRATPVGTRVNSVRHDDAALLEPICL